MKIAFIYYLKKRKNGGSLLVVKAPADSAKVA